MNNWKSRTEKGGIGLLYVGSLSRCNIKKAFSKAHVEKINVDEEVKEEEITKLLSGEESFRQREYFVNGFMI